MSTPSPDDELMALLAEAEADRALVTPEARAAARGAFAWRTIDEDLMELTFDSREAESLVRDASREVRVIGFQGAGLTLELERDGDDLVGQVVPATGCRLTLLGRTGELGSVDADESGVFGLRLSGEAPWRLRVERPGVSETTGWLPL